MLEKYKVMIREKTMSRVSKSANFSAAQEKHGLLKDPKKEPKSSLHPKKQGDHGSSTRALAHAPRTVRDHNVKPSGRWDESVNEDGAVMSVGASSVAPISGPQANPTDAAVGAATQLKKKYKMLFRKKPITGVK
jgi:hypothetical protein